MPLERIDIEQFLLTEEILKSHGYSHYEISNYAKKDMQSRHNLHYWEIRPYLAFGPSAHGFDGERRFSNLRNLDRYIKQLKFILRIMMNQLNLLIENV